MDDFKKQLYKHAGERIRRARVYCRRFPDYLSIYLSILAPDLSPICPRCGPGCLLACPCLVPDRMRLS